MIETPQASSSMGTAGIPGLVLKTGVPLIISRFGNLSFIWMAFVLAEAVVIPFGMFLWKKESGKVLKYLEPINQIKIKGGKENGSKTDSRQRFAG